MRLLLLGGGAREHALGWKLTQSPLLSSLISLPGNPGLAELGPLVEGVPATAPGAVAALAKAEGIDLVIVGPEAPLAAGVVDALAETGVPAFGPGRKAARLEASKSFAKEIMRRAGIPTAGAQVFTEPASALDHLERHPGPYVVKADGLAAGKGVLVTDHREQAAAWVHRCFGGGFGAAGETVLIEEFLNGPELSIFALCDGEEAVPLAPARDYKRLGDGDAGPNTGGMGCYSPVQDLSEEVVAETMQRVIAPALAQLAAEGTPYIGFLYAGLVLTAAGPKVLEFNCRLGDPETQVILPRLEDDLLELILAGLEGGLGGRRPRWSGEAAVDVVLAADGYPDHPRKGDVISGIDQAIAVPGVHLFHAGTARRNGKLVTAGGRVLNVVGTGASLAEARAGAYRAASRINWSGKQFRGDIAGAA